MEDGAREVDASASSSRPMRVYVGGLSANVTASDVEKTFSSLGRVSRVEFVRKTNGLNFAFMDFEPNSDKAMAKLFSAYNGCSWKGGKLKLEKAKEHYLARLKREWAEDAKLMSATPINLSVEESAGHLRKLDCSNQESMQLRIFFPKLKRVKLLPFKGTGKHKYSFQRIEVPCLPIHFCDCEEHCGPSETANQKYISPLNTGVSEKELSIMNSVMGKLFEREDNGNAADGVISATDAIISDPSINETWFDKTETAPETDADNMVTNIGMGGGNDMMDLMQLKGGEKTSMDQESRFGKLEPSNNRLTRNKSKSHKRQKIEPTSAAEATLIKKAHPHMTGKTSEDEITPTPRSKSSENHPQKLGNFKEALPIENQTEVNTSSAQSIKGHHSWVQKSSWKDLVGEMGNSSFTISHVLPDANLVTPKLRKSNGSFTVNAAAVKKGKARSGGSSESLEVVQIPVEKAVAPSHVEISAKAEKIQANPDDAHKEPMKQVDQEEPKTATETGESGEVCTFMRSAESEKELAKARAVLNRYLKKKRSNEKNASNSLKGTRSRND